MTTKLVTLFDFGADQAIVQQEEKVFALRYEFGVSSLRKVE